MDKDGDIYWQMHTYTCTQYHGVRIGAVGTLLLDEDKESCLLCPLSSLVYCVH